MPAVHDLIDRLGRVEGELAIRQPPARCVFANRSLAYGRAQAADCPERLARLEYG